VISVRRKRKELHTHEEEARCHPGHVTDKRNTTRPRIHEDNAGIGDDVVWETEMGCGEGSERVQAASGNQPWERRKPAGDRVPYEEEARGWRGIGARLDGVRLVSFCVGSQ
jgi:hypothetical protein